MLLNVVQLLGCEITDSQIEIKVSESEKQFAKDILAANNVSDNDFIISLHPGGGRPAKHWLPERFAELANKLISEYKIKIILLGNDSEIKIAKQVELGIKFPVINLAGKTPTTKHLAAIIGQGNMFIGNDSGPMHLAIALKIPTIGIFGPAHPDYFLYGHTPWYLCIRKDIDNLTCWPCEKYYCPDNQCLKLITVDDVLTATKQLMRSLTGLLSCNVGKYKDETTDTHR
jgi:ADP-heptose:LPS heptosyltransferase